jgi:polyisoprenoid-binding protein YceI
MGISVFKTCAQDNVVSTTKGEITFFSGAPLEDIDAKNKHVISMLNTQSLEILVRIPINQFEFQNKLMQQHFNEKYLESDRYPYATFKGKMGAGTDFSKDGVYDVSAVGVLNLHGVDQKRSLTGKINISKGEINLDTRFNINLADHKIDIPKLVFNKIAERIAVHATLIYLPFKN